VRLVTSGWTEHHRTAALLVTTALVADLAGLTEDPPVPFAVGVAVLVCILASLALDAFGGAVVGIVCAAALAGLRQLTGDWDQPAFAAALVETVAIVVAGVVAGTAGARLRRGVAPSAPSPLEPVYGSLGLFSHDVAMARLEEEVERAREHQRPLSLVVVDVSITRADLPHEGVSAALRAVARIVESRIGDRDVPFALAVDRLGVVLPESGSDQAWGVVGDILNAMDGARYTFGTQREMRRLADDINVDVGLAQYGPSLSTADAMLDAAVAVTRDDHGEEKDSLAVVSQAEVVTAGAAGEPGGRRGRHRAVRSRRLVYTRSTKPDEVAR
jgi:GGDEF domain-containing protein